MNAENNTQQDQRYNGWTNYATWGVALVLDNDQGTYGYVRERAEEAKDEAERRFQGRPHVTASLLADAIKDFTEELCELGDSADPTMMARQVIMAGLAEVNWREIAENILSES